MTVAYANTQTVRVGGAPITLKKRLPPPPRYLIAREQRIKKRLRRLAGRGSLFSGFLCSATFSVHDLRDSFGLSASGEGSCGLSAKGINVQSAGLGHDFLETSLRMLRPSLGGVLRKLTVIEQWHGMSRLRKEL